MKRQKGNDLIVYQVSSPEVALLTSLGIIAYFAVFAQNLAYKKVAAVFCSTFFHTEWVPLIVFGTARIIELAQAHCAPENCV